MTDVMLVAGLRTPIGRRRGALADAHPAEMFGALMRQVLAQAEIRPEDVSQVIGGCVTTVGDQAANITRTAWLTAGLPPSVPGVTVDARCGSSQQAVHYAAGLVASQMCDVVVCGGVEHMSRHPLGQDSGLSDAGTPFSTIYRNQYETTSQGEAAERIAQRWRISREECDEIALISQERAGKARTNGRFEIEIMPVHVSGEGSPLLLEEDEGPRPSTAEGLADLVPVFREDGVHTAGNSSQISDGASCVVIASGEWTRRSGVRPLAAIEHNALVGVDPVIKLTGPIPATQKVLQRSGLRVADIDIVECNEAFASVVGAWRAEIEPDYERVNVNGGAIALGHPVGATGARLLLTAAQELRSRGAQRALVTMCCGGGLGTATILRAA